MSSILLPHPPDPNPELPAVDEHIVPEGERWELVSGARIVSPPSYEPHATRHTDLAYVLRAHVAEGFSVAIDMLTRSDLGEDFAPDLSIYPTARDPDTGGRQIEALAFEVVSQQSMAEITRRAITLARRGVRRIFAIKLRKGSQTLLEFQPQSATWTTRPSNTHIHDDVLTLPLPVRDLLNAACADASVVRALLARQVPEIMAPILEQRQRAETAEARAEQERARAEAHARQLEQERQRAEQAEARAAQAEAEREVLAAEVARLRARPGQEPGD